MLVLFGIILFIFGVQDAPLKPVHPLGTLLFLPGPSHSLSRAITAEPSGIRKLQPHDAFVT